MPARGGMAELSDAEVGRAVEYMMNPGAGKMVMNVPASTVPTAAPAASACRVGPGRHDRAAAAPPHPRAPRRRRRQEGLRRHVRGLPRHRPCRSAEVRRQGAVGAAHRARRQRALRPCAERLQSDAPERRQQGAHRRAAASRDRLHGGRVEVILMPFPMKNAAGAAFFVGTPEGADAGRRYSLTASDSWPANAS